VGEGVIGFFAEPAALQEQQQTLVPGPLATGEHGLYARTDVRPDLLPDFVGSCPQHPVALETYRWQISVVAEEDQLGAPRHPHRVARIQNDADYGLEGLRPAVRGSKRAATPVVCPHSPAHLTT